MSGTVLLHHSNSLGCQAKTPQTGQEWDLLQATYTDLEGLSPHQPLPSVPTTLASPRRPTAKGATSC